MRKSFFESMGFSAFSGLHGGLVLFEKIYLNPRSQIGWPSARAKVCQNEGGSAFIGGVTVARARALQYPPRGDSRGNSRARTVF
jgi:hypothetical protein